jgi:hypothetical protein
MRNFSPLYRIFFFITFSFILNDDCFSQKIFIQYDTIIPRHEQFIKNTNDSTTITFDDGFNNQPVEIDINSHKFTIVHFTSPNIGFAGEINIPKLQETSR